jgi:hypothetical protein
VDAHSTQIPRDGSQTWLVLHWRLVVQKVTGWQVFAKHWSLPAQSLLRMHPPSGNESTKTIVSLGIGDESVAAVSLVATPSVARVSLVALPSVGVELSPCVEPSGPGDDAFWLLPQAVNSANATSHGFR